MTPAALQGSTAHSIHIFMVQREKIKVVVPLQQMLYITTCTDLRLSKILKLPDEHVLFNSNVYGFTYYIFPFLSTGQLPF